MVWPLVGRDRELQAIGRMLADRSTSGVVVTGAAGVGKTRLAVEVSRVAASSGCTVEWVRATRSAASIPLGALATLLPPQDAASGDGAQLLGHARRALMERAGGRRLVLCVDDGQLLDEASAALVHQLVAAGEVFAVVTVRRDERPPDAVRALWKDELCGFVELGELSRGQVGRLLGAVLRGAIDGQSVNALWELTRGNALFVRELVVYGVDRGVLTEGGGVWRWRGELATGMRLAELVGAWGLDRADDADAALRHGEHAVSDEGLRDELVAQRVRLMAARGRPREALALAAPLLDDPGVREQVRLQAAVGAVEALFSRGRSDEAVALADRWLPVARLHREELPVVEAVLLGERGLALRFAGRLVEATEASEHSYEVVLPRRRLRPSRRAPSA